MNLCSIKDLFRILITLTCVTIPFNSDAAISPAGLVDHFDPATGVNTDSNGLVTSWLNQSDNNRSVTSSGAAKVIISDDGNKLLRFSSPENGGSLIYQRSSTSTLATGYTIFAVVNLDTNSNNNFARIHRSVGDTHSLFYRGANGNIELKANPLEATSRPSAVYPSMTNTADVVILTARLTSDSQELYINGFRVSRNETVINQYLTDPTTFEIGNGVVGEIGHVLVYDEAVTIDALNQTGSFLANLHNIQWGNLTTSTTFTHQTPIPPLQRVIAHRGNSSIAPENTLTAIRAAGPSASMVEFDVQISADGELVVIHDSTVDRTTNGTGTVVNLDYYGYIDTLDAGSWKGAQFSGEPVPTMAQAVQAAFAQGLIPIIERKSGDAQTYFTTLKALGVLDQVHIIAFNWNFIMQFRQLSPNTAMGALGGGEFNQSRIDQILAAGANYADWSHTNIDQTAIELAQKNILPVVVYTVNSTANLQNQLTLGVDGITTDFPDRLAPLTLSYVDWAARTINSLDTNQRGFNDDPDGDGLQNGIEHLLGTSPNSFDSQVLKSPRRSGNIFTFNHSLANDRAEDVTYIYEWSTDMIQWYQSGETSIQGQRVTITARKLTDSAAPDNDQIQVALTMTAGTMVQMFSRIRVSTP